MDEPTDPRLPARTGYGHSSLGSPDPSDVTVRPFPNGDADAMDRPHPPGIDARSVLVGLLLAAVVTNIVQLPSVERSVAPNYAATRLPPDTALAAMAGRIGATARDRFVLYTALAAWAPDARVTLPEDTGVLREHLLGLGRARELVVARSPDMEALPDLGDALVLRGDSSDVGPFVLAVAEPPATDIVGIHEGDVLYLLDARLLDTRSSDDTAVEP